MSVKVHLQEEDRTWAACGIRNAARLTLDPSQVDWRETH